MKQVSTGGSAFATITDLSPGQLYNFLVVAVNAHGIGNWTAPVEILTA